MPRWLDEMTEAVSRLVRPGTTEGRGRQKVVGPVSFREPGWYALPTANKAIDLDNLTDLRLAASPHEAQRGPSYQAIDCVAEAEQLRIRVGAHAPTSGLSLFAVHRPPGFLDQSLLEALRSLTAPGMATKLIDDRLDPVERTEADEGPFVGPQADALRACTRPGIRLIWGPPGTGKTTVLSHAIDHHVTRGKRVLLVSGTNVAVDNALAGTVELRNPPPGELLRVGTAHLASVATDPRVALPLLVRANLQDVTDARDAAERKLIELNDQPVLRGLADLDERLAGYDEAAYQQARERVANAVAVERADTMVEHASRYVQERTEQHAAAERGLADALADQEAVRPQREHLEEAATLAAELARLDLLVQRTKARLHDLHETQGSLLQKQKVLRKDSGRVRWRDKNQHARLGAEATRLEQEISGEADKLRRLQEDWADFERSAKPRLLYHEQAAHPVDETELERRDEVVIEARAAVDSAADRLRDAREEHACAVGEHTAAAALPGPSDQDRARVEAVDRGDLPELARRRASLRAETGPLLKQRRQLEEQHESLLRRLTRLRAEAEPELIREAKVVATTLARMRLNTSVAEGDYDVVLIDEAAAARLPELVVALAKARETAVLLGDFCQLGPIEPKNGPRQDNLKRWLTTDCFAQVGIRTPQQALDHAACASLLTTYRFGPHIVELVNRIAYGGHLEALPSRVHSDHDPQIVLVTTDELAQEDGLGLVRTPKSGRGRWWTGGSVISAAVAEHHRGRGESVGIITPYRAQAEATRDYLDDQSSSQQTPAVEIGTAHRFQGREFDITVLDLVEDGVEPGWTMQGRLDSSRQYERDGARLLNVGVSRAIRRVYVVTSWTSLSKAKKGTVLAALHDLAKEGPDPIVKGLRAAHYLGIEPNEIPVPADPLQQEIWGAFQGHLKWEAVYDEHSYFPAALKAIAEARYSIWLWSPWYGKRQETLLPHLRDATDRGVQTTVFVVDDRDTLVRRSLSNKDPKRAAAFAALLPALKAAVTQVVHVHDMHQKIMVIDEQSVFLGSVNTLSHHARHEIMVQHISTRFARTLLDHEHAQTFSRPPACRACDIPTELRRSRSDRKDHYWYWACPTKDCGTRQAVFPEHERHVSRPANKWS
jgi:hypothetical protein